MWENAAFIKSLETSDYEICYIPVSAPSNNPILSNVVCKPLENRGFFITIPQYGSL
jgi:hypothetical protein